MMKLMRTGLFCLSCLLSVVACSTAPTAPPVSHRANVDATNVVDAQYAGYKIVNKDGVRLYCRRDPIIGTRLQYQTTCLTEAELTQRHSATEQSMERMQAVPQTKLGN